MSATRPIAFFGLQVPAGDEPIPVISEVPQVGTIRITMAAIDPTQKPLEADQPKRATLKIMRRPLDFDDYEDSDEDSEEDSDEESEEEEEEETPKKKSKKDAATEKAIEKAIKAAKKNADKMEVDAEEEDSEDDEDEESEDGDFEIEEFVVCTLDPERNYQQNLEFTIDEDEEVFFKVIGNYDVYLTGNYVVPADSHDHDHDHPHGDDYDSEDDSEGDYDLSPAESDLDMYGDSDSEEDELDDVANPRITEIETDEEKPKKAEKADKKSLKRPAEEPAKAEEKPTEKLSKKQQKKLKANDGKAVDATQETPDSKKKTVEFAKPLEQGPTGSATKDKAADKKETKKPEASPSKPSGPRIVNGVKIEDKNEGKGAVAKNGSRLSMRYIGKLKNGKTFDSNIKGKPFTFRLGKGEVIKGWDIGLVGMKVGGERRIEIPAHLAYGSKGVPGIPGNSVLIFDVKLLEVK